MFGSLASAAGEAGGEDDNVFTGVNRQDYNKFMEANPTSTLSFGAWKSKNKR